jgi:hypothetical protein
MEIILEILFQVFGEFILQAIFELLWRGLALPFRRSSFAHPALVLFLYVLIGSVSGFVSVFLLPDALIAAPAIRIVNLILTPVALGFAFELLGRRRDKAGKERFALDRFSYGFTFAFVFGIVRYSLTLA